MINLFYKLKLPFSVSAIFKIESYLLNQPAAAKYFFSRIQAGALWKIAETKLIFLLKQYLKTTPALVEISKKHFPQRRISRIKDFKEVFPILDKDNYIKKFRLQDLCQNGTLPEVGSFYKSSGTSGQPTLWFESLAEHVNFDKTAGVMFEMFLRAAAKKYVIVNCWALSSWPTGIDFAAAARQQGKVINIGANLEEAVEFFKMMGPAHNFLLVGYPPFIFHLIQRLKQEGLNLEEYSIEIIAGGEGFVEKWRDELLRELGNRKILSVYGSTDKGLSEAIETSLAYVVRSLLYVASVTQTDIEQARRIMQLRFNDQALPFSKESAKKFLLAFLKQEEEFERIPMVFQFNPTLYYNENYLFADPIHKREVSEFLTTVLIPEITIPRVRYNIHDEGFVLPYDDLKLLLKRFDIKIKNFRAWGEPGLDLRLPFLFLFGRTDGTVSVDGANIYPDDIERCLSANNQLLETIYSFQLFITTDYRLGIALELTEGKEMAEELKQLISACLKTSLADYSFGYRELIQEKLRSANLVVEFYRFSQGPFKNRTFKLRYVQK